ncbi:MAG: hypothetical protein OEY24_07030 [Candidatus Bathyarchaeota archaeon]|nr:hypothetical protein [Candidatus Bathyarchaeota archaeon]MDH5495435.1 hypothetical protein [Candidatus Bathyarchaeota archaeon]
MNEKIEMKVKLVFFGLTVCVTIWVIALALKLPSGSTLMPFVVSGCVLLSLWLATGIEVLKKVHFKRNVFTVSAF